MEYTGGSFFGLETGAPTRTLLAFLVTSLGGNYEDMVCLAPTVTLNWSSLLKHFKEVLKALLSIGFNVVLILLDGHKINIRFLQELGNGTLEICIPNPLAQERKLFSMFDPVHLFKNFYHNFERRRYETKTPN